MDTDARAASFVQLADTIAFLRSENGCPWDRKQGIADFKRHLLEEAYEFSHAVDSGDTAEAAEELGDILLNILLIATAMEQAGIADITSVMTALREKVISRHPHVFGDKTAHDAQEALSHWDRAKKDRENKSLFGGLPVSAPSVMLAHMIAKRAAKIGFGFESAGQLVAKIREESAEVEHELASDDRDALGGEMGDLLFTLVCACQYCGIDPDAALRGTCAKFLNRFGFIEQSLDREGRSFFSASRDEIERLWEASKKPEPPA